MMSVIDLTQDSDTEDEVSACGELFDGTWSLGQQNDQTEQTKFGTASVAFFTT
jgi:hypothetical protein